jgi:hypothetical protein
MNFAKWSNKTFPRKTLFLPAGPEPNDSQEADVGGVILNSNVSSRGLVAVSPSWILICVELSYEHKYINTELIIGMDILKQGPYIGPFHN